MKLKDITSVPFNQGLEVLVKSKLPEKTAYWVAKRIINIRKEQSIFETFRGSKVIELSKKDENGEIVKNENGDYSVDPEKLGAFLKSINEFLDVEVSIEPIQLNDLGVGHGLLPIDFLNLGEFIVD